jgi:uncharacterized protein YcbX
VKSAAGINVPGATLTPRGLRVSGYADHEFVIVRAQAGVDGRHGFLTQRDMRGRGDVPQGFSAIARIKPRIVDGALQLAWDNKDAIAVPPTSAIGRDLPVTVWEHQSNAIDQGDDIALWLSDHLGAQVRLVRAPDSFERSAKQNVIENGNTLLFQDGYPIHWFSAASIAELSAIAGKDVPWQSFRPQIVADGFAPQHEHQIGSGRIAGIPFTNAKPCDRCETTNVDQETGEVRIGRALTPLATYKKWRNNRGELKVIFGENMLPLGEGTIAIGDEITVDALREPALVYGARA